MPKAYSWDMRERVIAEVESGASRREAAEEFKVSASTATIWVRCFRETGPLRGQTAEGQHLSVREHANFLLGLIEKQPDLTLDEMGLRLGAGARGRGARPSALDARTGHV